MVRVLIVSPTSERGGPEAGLLELVRNVNRQRFALRAVFPAPGPYTARMVAEGIDVDFAPMAFIERDPRLLFRFLPELLIGAQRVARLARDWSADLIFTNCSASLVGVLAARWLGLPHVTYLREARGMEKKSPLHVMYRWFYNGSAQLIAVSHAICQIALKEYDPQRVEVVYDSLDHSWFAPSVAPASLRADLGLCADQPVISTVARLVPQKGIHCFIEAAALVHHRYPTARFLIVGDIPRPRFQRYKDRLLTQVHRLGLKDVVLFLGWRDDIKDILSLSTVNVLASIGLEGAGRVIAEGWAVRVPAVVARHSGPAEIVRHGVDGLHFCTGDAADLARCIERLLAEPETRAAMQEAGRARAEELFDARRNAQSVERVWERALGREHKKWTQV